MLNILLIIGEIMSNKSKWRFIYKSFRLVKNIHYSNN